jgi:hypothetical protein
MNWIQLDQALLNVPRTETHKGATLQAFASPYDIPSAIRADYEPATKQGVLSLRYMAPDEELSASSMGDVEYLIGSNSRRIYKIKVNLERPDWTRFVGQVGTSIRELAQSEIPVRIVKNYAVVGEAVAQLRQELVGEPAGVRF